MDGAVFIVGPTSVGKSNCAQRLADQAGGEIVNADAFQVYRGLGLLTSSPGAWASAQVPHHLFGTVSPADSYNVARYLAEATACLRTIRDRRRPAIVGGGTGLYVKALTHGLSPLPAPAPALRAELEARELPDLLEELRRVDAAACGQIDVKNKRRIVRALEVCRMTGTPFSSHREAWAHSAYGSGQAGVFLDRDRQDVRRRIDRQVESMFEAGVVHHARDAGAETLGATAAGTIGLAEIQELLAGRCSLADCKDRIKTRTAQYAKRQVTWFKKESVFRRVVLPADSEGSAELRELLHALVTATHQSRSCPSC